MSYGSFATLLVYCKVCKHTLIWEFLATCSRVMILLHQLMPFPWFVSSKKKHRIHDGIVRSSCIIKREHSTEFGEKIIIICKKLYAKKCAIYENKHTLDWTKPSIFAELLYLCLISCSKITIYSLFLLYNTEYRLKTEYWILCVC